MSDNPIITQIYIMQRHLSNSYQKSEEIQSALLKTNELSDEISKKISDNPEIIQLFNQFNKAIIDHITIVEETAFSSGFKTGFKLSKELDCDV